jgi:guanylate kinase
MQDRRLLIIAGLSAAGKTVVSRELIGRSLGFTTIRSVTTRAPRGDGNDSEYFYLTEDEFYRAAESGELLEYMKYTDAMYGTPRSELERAHGEGLTPLLVLDLCGVKSFSEASDYKPCCVFLYEDLNLLEDRLYTRYIGDKPSVEGLNSFVKRKERNIDDSFKLPDMADCFYSFVRNRDSIAETADEVLRVFGDFCAGVPRDADACREAAQMLCSLARAKRPEDAE